MPSSCPQPARPYHVLLTASSGAYQEWQTRAFYHHYLLQRRHDACGELGGFTRLLTRPAGAPADALEAEMPLFVDAEDDEIVIRGLGSSASLVGDEIVACNGVLHMVDHCLLPFDGDGELNDAQKARLRDAKRALDARYPERPTSIDPDAYEDESDDDDDDDDDKEEEDSDDDDSDSDDDDDDDDDDDSDDDDDEKKT